MSILSMAHTIRNVNNYSIGSFGGHILIRHWIVYDKNETYMGTFFKYGKAKEACVSGDFSGAYKGPLY